MIKRPIIILGAPRSGTTILQRALSLHSDLWHLPGESHFILEGPFKPDFLEVDSNRVGENSFSEQDLEQLRERFYQNSINLNKVTSNPSALFSGTTLIDRILAKLRTRINGSISISRRPKQIRLLEKTPKNSLRVPMLNALFPDALFLWLKRNPTENIDSLIDGWLAKDRVGPFTIERFARSGYRCCSDLGLADYSGEKWKFALVPEWRSLRGRTLADVASWQYYQCNNYIAEDLEKIEKSRIHQLKFEDFIRDPLVNLKQILYWAELSDSSIVHKFAEELPQVNTTRKVSGSSLRYPQKVKSGIGNLKQLEQLKSVMGY